ncbi:MAG: metallophosphoesterase [Candidatus Bathyarchaeota archaeon]|nr:metallophosphoesterase [Candidatus Bathyarchaeota archaeon]MDH5788520.1 metallophosphoesterase [Candidatus Bathyarchaeota archaeon]
MLLAQISDVHCGPMFRGETLRAALREINEMNPDVVLVTGDLTENGLMSEFNMAAKELKKLKSERIIFVSGNHDYRSTGYLLFKEYFSFVQTTEIDNAALIVLSSARPDRDDGEVGHRQNLWLEKTLEKNKNKVKIVAIHHHIIPVPDTGADQITIIDAGDVLRSLTKSKANLVLCGHRHRPWRWKMEDMLVVHAGSVSCEKLRGFFCNSYNIISVKGNKIEAKLKIVGGDFVDFDEIVKRREILQKSDISQYSDSLAR